MIPTPKFRVGEIVARAPFTDCFGEFHTAIPHVIVTSIRLILDDCPLARYRMAPYYRITVSYPSGHTACEGPERFFIADPDEKP